MQETFDKLPRWIDYIKEDASPDVQLTLLGNKCDLRREDGSDESVDYMEAKVLNMLSQYCIVCSGSAENLAQVCR